MPYHKLLLTISLILIATAVAFITYKIGNAQVTNSNIFNQNSTNEVLEITNPSPTMSSTSQLDPSYKVALATFFWVGESADESNGFISNVKSSWDSQWTEHYGGIDDPEDRCGYFPCSFTPKENPFYFALPYNDLDDQGNRRASAQSIPWFTEKESDKSVLKNYWIEVKYFDRTCYAQWQDVGPFESNDYEYVFGQEEPKNKQGIGAGIDLSPAVRDCLGMKTNDRVGWKFISGEKVPVGAWTQIITTRPVSW